MAYIGNTVQTQGFAPAVDYFNGDGTTVTFTLSRPVASVAQLTAVIDNVIQNPSTAFTVAGSSITFTSAPLAGTNNIWVEYTSLVTTYAAISQDPSVIGDITATGGFLATGDFGNTYVDGTIVDYVTGNTRITTGPVDGMTFYNGGPNARNALMTLDTNGNMGLGTTSPLTKLVVSNGSDNNFEVWMTAPAGGSATTLQAYNRAGSAWKDMYYASANHYFNTGGTQRMTIDSSGYVTKPYQPYIRCQGNSSSPVSVAANTIITWWANVGTPVGISRSGGRFTVPVTGKYVILGNVYWYPQNSGQGEERIYYKKNGSNVGMTNAEYTSGTFPGDISMVFAITLDMSASDYFELVVESASTFYQGNDHNTFTMYLLG